MTLNDGHRRSSALGGLRRARTRNPLAACVVAAGSLTWSLTASADGPWYTFATMQQLHQACTSSEATQVARCEGYIAGQVDALTEIMIFENSCFFRIQTTPTPADLAKIVTRWIADDPNYGLKKHPENSDQSGATAILGALGQHFPC